MNPFEEAWGVVQKKDFYFKPPERYGGLDVAELGSHSSPQIRQDVKVRDLDEFEKPTMMQNLTGKTKRAFNEAWDDPEGKKHVETPFQQDQPFTDAGATRFHGETFGSGPSRLEGFTDEERKERGEDLEWDPEANEGRGNFRRGASRPRMHSKTAHTAAVQTSPVDSKGEYNPSQMVDRKGNYWSERPARDRPNLKLDKPAELSTFVGTNLSAQTQHDTKHIGEEKARRLQETRDYNIEQGRARPGSKWGDKTEDDMIQSIASTDLHENVHNLIQEDLNEAVLSGELSQENRTRADEIGAFAGQHFGDPQRVEGGMSGHDDVDSQARFPKPHTRENLDKMFEKAWDEVQKAILPDIDPRIVSVLRPNYNLMYSDSGPIQHDIRMKVKDAIPIVEENIDKLGRLRNRRYDQWPKVYESGEWASDEEYEDARSGRQVIERLLRETDPDGQGRGLDLFDHPEHIEQRRIARHGDGDAASWIPFQQAIAPRYLEYLLDKEKEKSGDHWTAVATGSADLSGNVGNMNLMPGMGGQGIGPHLLGSMLETYGSIGDSTYSPEAYKMWNRLGEKMTEGGIGRRMTINRPSWRSGDHPDTVDHIIRRTNPAGDMIFQRPVFSRKGYYSRPPSWQMKGTKWQGPSAHPYSFDRIQSADYFKGAKRRTNPSLFGTYPLELRYTGDELNPITNMRRYVGAMEGLPYMHEHSWPKNRIERHVEKNPDSRLQQLLSRGIFDEEGWMN